MNTELCIRYLLRDRPELQGWIDQGIDKPWMIQHDGTLQWDDTILGRPCPTPEELESALPLAIAWETLQKWAPEKLQDLALFRMTLQRYWGAGAETNQAVSQQSVTGYFIQKHMTAGLTNQELGDSEILAKLYVELAPLCPDGTTWTAPYELIP